MTEDQSIRQTIDMVKDYMSNVEWHIEQAKWNFERAKWNLNVLKERVAWLEAEVEARVR